jgi:hypothetical protein
MPAFNKVVNRGLVDKAPAQIVQATRYKGDMNLVEAAANAEQPNYEAQEAPNNNNKVIIGVVVLAVLLMISLRK